MKIDVWKILACVALIPTLGCSPGGVDSDEFLHAEYEADVERAEVRMTQLAELHGPPTVADHGLLVADLDVDVLTLPGASSWTDRGSALSAYAAAGDWEVRVSLPAADPLTESIAGAELRVDLADIQGITMRSPDGELVEVGGSLADALQGASATLCGDVVAVGWVDVAGVPVAVELATMQREIDIEFDPFGECDATVWGADDCNDGKCRILVDFEDFGILVRGKCVFRDVPWNPWNYCICRF